jgi:hypothetical protein
MGRLEKFRQARNIRHKYFLSAVIFLFLLVAGMVIADYSVNSLIEGDMGVSVFAVENSGKYIEITFMNQKLYVNTQYINRDLGKLKLQVARLFGQADAERSE